MIATAKNATLGAAFDYLERGFALLPVGKDKRPYWDLLPTDRRGKPIWAPLAANPVGRREIEQWLQHDPDCNIGIITGKPSGGVVVADFDRKPPRGLFMPPTPRVVTARQFHCYFRASRAVAGRSLPWGEVKSDGCYCLLPPSRHPSGHVYRWEDLLSLEDVNLAECPGWLVDPKARSDRREVSREYSLLTSPVAGFAGMELGAWGTNEDFVIAVCEVLGIPVYSPEEIGKAFRCVLPGHTDRHPSASLFRRSDGLIAYHDWHGACGQEWLDLAEVRASLAYGSTVKLRGPEKATWHLRLIVEAGFATPACVELSPLPNGASNAVRRVYDGFKLLLGCKWLYDYGAPTAFSWRFAAAWCGLSERHTGGAITDLLRLGIIQVVSRYPMTLYLPV